MEITKEQALELEEFYTVYRTTNTISGRYYIGRHKIRTENFDSDEYLGSGNQLLNDIDDLGKDKFEREILHYYDTYSEHKDKEKDLLVLAFESGDSIYNESTSNGGGWENCNTKSAREKRSRTMKSKGMEYTERFRTDSANAKRKLTMKSKGKELLRNANLPEYQDKRKNSLVRYYRDKAAEKNPEYLDNYSLIDSSGTKIARGNIFQIVDSIKESYGKYAYYRIYSLLDRICEQGRLKGFKLIKE